MVPTTLTTERLTLRPPRLDDAEALFDRYASDPEATHYLSWQTHRSPDEMREFLAGHLDGDSEDTHWVACLRDDADNRPWGMATLFGEGPPHIASLGYVLARPLWGRGLMTETMAAVIEAVWRDDRVWRVSAYAHIDKVGSHRVLEKCGLRREGVSRRLFLMPQCGLDPQDCVRYAKVRDDL